MAFQLPDEHAPIEAKIRELYTDLFLHDGYGAIRIEMRFLKKGQKEIIVSSGKDYRYVVDWTAKPGPRLEGRGGEGFAKRCEDA